MVTGEDLPEDLFQPFLEATPAAGRDALFAWMIAPALVWLSVCRGLYRASLT